MKKNLFLLFAALISFQAYAQYKIDTLITGLNKPVVFNFLPSGNIIMTHKDGPVKIYTLNNTVVSTFWNFSDSCHNYGEDGTIGVCLDPNYNTNHYIYIYYTHNNPQSMRVVRLTENNNVGTNPFLVFNHRPDSLTGFHVGGNIKFGPDSKLYITIGETAIRPNAQMLTNPLGKISRVNSNGTIPTDNPFYDDGNPLTGNDDRIWCYGLRNSFDFIFSPVNDSLYAIENGTTLFDEVNFIRKGKNYGWPVCEGYCVPFNPAYIQPMHVWSPSVGLAGILIYKGNVMPEFNGKLLAADNNSARIYKCDLGEAPDYDTITSVTQVFDFEGGLTTIVQGADGFIYALNGGYTTTGKLYRIKPDNIGVQNNHNIADGYELKQNYPNPFNPTTSISFSIGKASFVTLKIFDALGKEVESIVSEYKPSGSYNISWNAGGLPSGIYFYQLTAGDYKADKKMVLIK